MTKYLLPLLLSVAGCGSDPATPDAPSPDAPPDTPVSQCQAQGAVGNFYRRTPNPRLVAGTHAYTDGTVDIAITDPDLFWDGAAWQLYYHGPNSVDYASPITPMIRHASSPDLAAWTIDDAPALVAPTDAGAWDHMTTETPTVVYNPDAPADRRYLMLYSGANATFPNYPFPGYAIGAAFSADGKTFTRIAASESPHALAGQVLTASDAYPGLTGVVADPELAYVAGTYHLWFSSFACMGTNCAMVSAYGISHATSTDGVHWSVLEAPVRSLLRLASDRTTGGGQPSVVYDAVHCRWEMWLRSDSDGESSGQPVVFNNMVGVRHATSSDAMTWSINYNSARDLAWNAAMPDPGEHLGLLTGADVAIKNGGRYMVFSGFDDQNVPAGFALPDHSQQGFEPGVITLNVATRDAL